ncbi:uncharacterized protein [Nicotiana sylvestris]|uniref:uncharacterized protein n=1 Tax=Nicotiana sylvestris TaxID=4096 RepID=UPI00388C97AB
MSSPNPNPRRVPIVDNFPLAPSRSRRGGRLCNLGSSSIRDSSLPSSSSSPSFRTRGSFSQRSSSRGKEPSEPVREPIVEEIVHAELSFYNDRESFRNQVSSLDRVDTYPTQIIEGFKPAIDPVILKFCHFFDVCLSQISPIVLFRQCVFTLVARIKRVLVSPEDDRDCGWYARFAATPIVGLVGDENITFSEKWNFAPTMGIVDEIANFRGWVGKLLYTASMEGRSWKALSQRFGWKVKTHGFAVRGISAEAVVASRISLERAQEIILGSSSKRKVVVDQDSEEEEDRGSLVKRPRARRRIISDDEASPPRSVPLIESVEAQVSIPDDDIPIVAHDLVEQLFNSGFGGENLGQSNWHGDDEKGYPLKAISA